MPGSARINVAYRPPATRRYGVAATPTSNAVAVASPLHRRCAVVVLMQRQLMLGARAQHQRSRPCWRTRFLCLRSGCHCVVVTSSWSRLSDHCCCRSYITVALLSRRRSHFAFSRRLPPILASCRPALLVGHVGRPWLLGLVGRVVGVVVAVPGGGRRAYVPRRCLREPRGEWPLAGPPP